MKFKPKRSERTFDYVGIGDTFISKFISKDDNELFMRTGTFGADATNGCLFNAVSLETGEMVRFCNDAVIIPVKVEAVEL